MPLEENTVLKAWVTATSECEPVEPEAAAADVTRADIEQMCQALEDGIASDLVRDPAGLAHFAWQVAELSSQPEVVTRHAAATFVDVCLRDGLDMRRRADQVAQALELVGGGMPADWASQTWLALGDAVNPRISLSTQKRFIDPLEPELQVSRFSAVRLMQLPYVEEFDGEPCLVGYDDLYGQDELLAPVGYYTRAYDVAQAIEEPDGRRSSQVQALARLGECLLANGDETQGLAHLQEALALLDLSDGDRVPLWASRLGAKLLTRLAERHRSKSNFGDAVAAQEEAVVLGEMAFGEGPLDAARLCWLLLRLAAIRDDLGDSAEAVATVERAFAVAFPLSSDMGPLIMEVGWTLVTVLERAPTDVQNSSMMAQSLADYPRILGELFAGEAARVLGSPVTPWAHLLGSPQSGKGATAKAAQLRSGGPEEERALLFMLNADQTSIDALREEYVRAASDRDAWNVALLCNAARVPCQEAFAFGAQALDCLLLLRRIAGHVTSGHCAPCPDGRMDLPGFSASEARLLAAYMHLGKHWGQYVLSGRPEQGRDAPCELGDHWDDGLHDDEPVWLSIGKATFVRHDGSAPGQYYRSLWASELWSFFDMIVGAALSGEPDLRRCAMWKGEVAYLDFLLGLKPEPPTCGRYYIPPKGSECCGRDACQKVHKLWRDPRLRLAGRAKDVARKEYGPSASGEPLFDDIWSKALVPGDPKASLLRFRELASRTPNSGDMR